MTGPVRQRAVGDTAKISSTWPCLVCGSRQTIVTDSRRVSAGTRRRRGCISCDHRWTTYETAGDTPHRELLDEARKLVNAARDLLTKLETFDAD